MKRLEYACNAVGYKVLVEKLTATARVRVCPADGSRINLSCAILYCRSMAQQWVTGSPDGTFLTRQPPTSLTPHRSAPALSPYYVKGRGASDPLRGLRPWSFAGAGPEVPAWSRHTTASAAKTGIVYHVPVAPAWRPPGQSVGLHVPFEHRRPPPPPPPRLPPPSDPAQGDLSTEVLTAELRKTTAILAKAHAQLHEERQISAMRAEETESQLALAAEMGRQEERHAAQAMVDEARGTLSTLVNIHERGAAYVKQTERGMIASALAEQRRGLEEEIRQSKLATDTQQAELRRAAEERHKREMEKMLEEVQAAQRALAVAEEKAFVLARKFENTREGRIDFMYNKFSRKLLNGDLARGWQSLITMRDDKLYMAELVRISQGRCFFLFPTIRSAFSRWTTLKADLEALAKLRAEQAEKDAEQARVDRIAELEAELVKVRKDCEVRLADADSKLNVMQKRMSDFQRERADFNLLVDARSEEERSKRVALIQRHAGYQVRNHQLNRGWKTWADQYKRYREEQRRAKVYREAQMRMMKPHLAKPFIHWRVRWQNTSSKQRRKEEVSVEEKLQEAVRLHGVAEQETSRVRALLAERDQALALANVALEDERRALMQARGEAAEAKTMMLQARESTTKLAASELRVKELNQRIGESAEVLERERAEAKRSADQQRLLAETELKRLLADQRQSLEAQMVLVVKEADERIRMIEDQCRMKLESMQRQQVQIVEERIVNGEPALTSPVPEDEQVGYRRSGLHPVWGRGPDLNTAERAAAWEQYQKAKEEAQKATPPTLAWAFAQRSAEAYRAARRFPIAPLAKRDTPRSSTTSHPTSARGGAVGSARLPTASARGGGLQMLRNSASAGALQPGTSIEPICNPRAALTVIPSQSSVSVVDPPPTRSPRPQPSP